MVIVGGGFCDHLVGGGDDRGCGGSDNNNGDGRFRKFLVGRSGVVWWRWWSHVLIVVINYLIDCDH